MSKVFFTSDLHFSHRAIIEFCDRPFKDVDHMNASLIQNWNSVVSPEDTVYMLGDIFFCNRTAAMNIMDQLNGHKNLVMGNHDRVIRENVGLQKKFSLIMDNLDDVYIDNMRLILCHFPLLHWDGSHRGNCQLHGHLHNMSGDYTQPGKRQYDVGMDNNGYYPVQWETIKEKMLKITDYFSHH